MHWFESHIPYGFKCEDKKSIVVGLSSVRICFPVYFVNLPHCL
jgi:hypothetical protein